jgi:HAMP domain-containing protein
MPVIIEAILVSAGMLLIFALAFFAMFLLAITMSPIERSLSKIIWDATAPKRPLPAPPKGSFRDFSRKH